MLRFAVLGLGSVSNHHIKSIQELATCQLVAVASSRPEQARKVGEQYNVDFFSDYQEVLQHPGIDAVSICTTSGQHRELTLAAAKAGKHVLVEKPLEITTDRIDEMIAACAKAGVQLACIFQNRFTDAYLQVEKVVKAGKLGKLVLGNAYIKWFRNDAYYASRDWRGTLDGDGGAALMNQSIHTIDLLQNLMGPVDNLFGKIATRTHDIEGEDVGIALLQFKNGALGTIEGSTSAWPGYPERLEIFGEKGSIIMEGGKIIAWNVKDIAQPIFQPAEAKVGAADPMAIDYILHKRQIQDFAEAILNKKSPAVDGQEARKAVAIIRAIYESSKENKSVHLT
jgi:predicted dehydrogenase